MSRRMRSWPGITATRKSGASTLPRYEAIERANKEFMMEARVQDVAHTEDVRLTPSPEDIEREVGGAAVLVHTLDHCREPSCKALRIKLRVLSLQARELTEEAVRVGEREDVVRRGGPLGYRRR